jgi:hypothetical protein
MKDDLPSTRLALATGAVMALGAGLITAGVIVGAAAGNGQRPVPHTGDLRLVAYDSCATALTQMKERILPHVTPYGLDFGGYGRDDDVVTAEGDGRMAAPDAAPAPDGMPVAPKAQEPDQEQDHSTTNVQEKGVDEPDLVKTDGRRIVSITDGVLRVVDVKSRKQTATVHLDGTPEGGYPTQMLVAGDRALLVMSPRIVYDAPRYAPGDGDFAPTDTVPYGSRLALVDLTGAGAVLGTLSVDGDYLDARQIGDVARVVVHSTPHLPFRYGYDATGEATALSDNRKVVADSTIQDWLPRYELSVGGTTSTGQLTGCDDVSHPTDYTAGGMLTVLTLDLGKELGTGDPVTIVADGSTVYGTDKNLYVADDHMMSGIRTPTPGPGPASGRTDLYQFDISGPGKPVHVASGAVDGTLLNQYSLSEHGGNLRVATTTADRGTTQSMITVLSRKGNELTQVGQVGGLGAGERIYAVRFFDDTAYVVTFRQTDPLYTVDLRDPAAPRVTGELKITGYSAYLHPAGDGRLIGVGQEAGETGGTQGAQVSLFDTSDPAGARRLAQYHLKSTWSDAENDPHAFLYWPKKNLVLLPVSGGMADENGQPEDLSGLLVLRLEGGGFEQAGLISHASERMGEFPVVPRRAIVIGDELWTVSEAGAMASDIDSLAQLAWLPFT